MDLDWGLQQPQDATGEQLESSVLSGLDPQRDYGDVLQPDSDSLRSRCSASVVPYQAPLP